MKKIIISLIFVILLLNIVGAQDISTVADIKEAGILPSSILYGIDLALERVTELFSENAKLLHAKERLAEVKIMIDENKIEQAEKTRLKFEELRLRIKDKTKIEEHKKLMDNLGAKISAIASTKGKLTEQQKLEIKYLIEQHKEKINNETEMIDRGKK